MNIQKMMQEAQKLQKEIENITKELESKIYTSDKDLVYLEANGKKEILTIKFKENVETDETIEDMLTININNLFKEIDLERKNKLGKFGPSLSGLM